MSKEESSRNKSLVTGKNWYGFGEKQVEISQGEYGRKNYEIKVIENFLKIYLCSLHNETKLNKSLIFKFYF